MNKYYKILGVNEYSTKEEIKRAHRNLLKKYHPDTYEGDKSYASRKSAEINEAYAHVLAYREEKGYKDPPKAESEFNCGDSFKQKEEDKPKEVKTEKLKKEDRSVKQEKVLKNKCKRELTQKEKRTKLVLDISIVALTMLTIGLILFIALS